MRSSQEIILAAFLRDGADVPPLESEVPPPEPLVLSADPPDAAKRVGFRITEVIGIGIVNVSPVLADLLLTPKRTERTVFVWGDS